MDTNIITQKITAGCCQSLCLTHKEIGPARTSNGIIRPPQTATSVTAENLRIKKIYTQKKIPHPKKVGCWETTIGFTFEYLLLFWDMNGCQISTVEAGNAYSMNLTLCDRTPHENENMVATSDLPMFVGHLFSADVPQVRTAATADLLNATIYHNPYKDCADEVHVTIGLCTAVQLLRYACLTITNTDYEKIPPTCTPNTTAVQCANQWDSFCSFPSKMQARQSAG